MLCIVCIFCIWCILARQCSARGGELWLAMREDGRLDVSGFATVVMEGKLYY